jgi:hypothetical protein
MLHCALDPKALAPGLNRLLIVAAKITFSESEVMNGIE